MDNIGESQEVAEQQQNSALISPNEDIKSSDELTLPSPTATAENSIDQRNKYLANRDYHTMVFHIPDSFDKFFEKFDSKIISICQHFHPKPLILFSKFLSVWTTIEIGIAIPFVLFFLGLDLLGQYNLATAFALGLITQIPKRFLFRPRPYTVGRALKFAKDATSSFPSRAVTCAVVYSFAFCYSIRLSLLQISSSFYWEILFWTICPIITIINMLLASYSRISLGVHYPSDCLFACLQGLFIIILGLILFYLHGLITPTCSTVYACYSLSDAFSFYNLQQWNYLIFIFTSIAFIIFAIVMVIKPIQFYTKFHHVFSFSLACEAFQLCFLSKNLSFDTKSALPVPPSIPSWYSFVLVFVLTILFTIVGMKGPKKNWSILTFIGLYSVIFTSLSLWRLANL